MKIHFFGAARTTTGSMYLIEVNGKKLLLECGLFQGRREESEKLNKTLPFDPRQVNANLVLPAGPQFDFDERPAIPGGHHLVTSDCLLRAGPLR